MVEVATSATVLVDTKAIGASVPSVGSAELPSARSESERLKLERDKPTQFRAELAAIGKPWWRKGSIVMTLTALTASVVPVMAAPQVSYQKGPGLALQESRQRGAGSQPAE